MRKFLTAAATAAVLSATPAAAATFIVTYNAAPAPILIPPASPAVGDTVGNEFQLQLAALGVTHYVGAGASIVLTGSTSVDFAYLGSESGFTDTFTAGPVSGVENNTNNFAAPVSLGTAAFGGMFPAFTANFTSSGHGLTHAIGTSQFGIFINPLLSVNNGNGTFSYTASTLYFGYDDNGANFDDNHDDFIVSAAAVPEPATWAMMIGGLGLVGATMRRRGSQRVVSA